MTGGQSHSPRGGKECRRMRPRIRRPATRGEPDFGNAAVVALGGHAPVGAGPLPYLPFFSRLAAFFSAGVFKGFFLVCFCEFCVLAMVFAGSLFPRGNKVSPLEVFAAGKTAPPEALIMQAPKPANSELSSTRPSRAGV